MLEVKNLTKRYGEKRAVNNISFSVRQGEIVGFLGPNGAGKSTTMNIITGYLSSSEGTVTVDGLDVLQEPIKAKAKIGYLPEHPPLYLDMTVREYLDFLFDLKKLRQGKRAHIEEICQLVKISDVYERMIKNLSKGYRQRVGLAGALLGTPDLLILDEPTVGLDPKQIIEIRSLIRSLGERHTVILSSHILPEIQAVCDRVLVMNKGQIVADDTPDNLSNALSGEHNLNVRIRGPREPVEKLLRALPNIKTVEPLHEREPGSYDYTLEAEPGFDLRGELFARLCERGWPILALRPSELTLEEIFLSLTGDEKVSLEEEGALSPEAETPAAQETAADETKEDASATEGGEA